MTNNQLFAQGKTAPVGYDPTPQDYVAFYPLTGTAEDVTGVYNGTEIGGLTYIDDASRGSVASFDGVNDRIDCGTKFLGDDYRTPYTMSVHIMSSDLVDATGYGIITQGYGGTGGGFNALYLSAGNYISYYEGDQTYSWTGIGDTVPIIAGTWYHITITRTINGLVSVYKDTVLLGTFTPAQGVSDNYNTTIGEYSAGAYGVKLNISNVRFYDRAITAEEITTIYDYEKVTHHIPVDDGLIAYYPLNNNSLDNYYQQKDGADASVTYDGVSALMNATSDLITLPLGIFTLGQNFTVSFWYKPTAFTHNRIVLRFYDNVRVYFLSTTVSGSSGYAVYVNGSAITYLNGTQVLDNVYHHMVIRQFGTTFEMQIDGVIRASGVSTASYPTTVGSTIGGAGYTPTGEWSNLRIYNRDITDSEITAIYDAELAEHTT